VPDVPTIIQLDWGALAAGGSAVAAGVAAGAKIVASAVVAYLGKRDEVQNRLIEDLERRVADLADAFKAGFTEARAAERAMTDRMFLALADNTKATMHLTAELRAGRVVRKNNDGEQDGA
jgi:hypothetical protein